MPKFWNRFSSWQDAETHWDIQSQSAQKTKPIKKLKVLPQIPGIAKGEDKYLKWKSFKYVILRKEGKAIRRHVLQSPIKYAFFYLRSLLIKPFEREDDFFLYGIKTVEDFEKQLSDPEALLVVGFSYCQKPFECPDGRFTDKCSHNVENLVCRQCDIGKAVHALPEKRVIPLIVPTVHYIGEKMFEIKKQNQKKKVLFLITACEMTLTMFGDFGNMLNIKGIGVRLDGRICNTMKAFILSEEGIKPGLTVLTERTQKRLLSLIRTFRSS